MSKALLFALLGPLLAAFPAAGSSVAPAGAEARDAIQGERGPLATTQAFFDAMAAESQK